MPRQRPANWISLSLESWSLCAEAGSVIWLRSLRMMAGGPLAEREAQRMVSEKLTAHADFATKLVTGQAGHDAESMAGKALGHYGKTVRANHRRLTAK